MIFLDFNSVDKPQIAELENTIKREVLNHEFTSDLTSFLNSKDNKVFVTFITEHWDENNEQNLKTVLENEDIKVLEIHLSDKTSFLSENGFPFIKHKDINSTIALIKYAIDLNRFNNFQKHSITKEHDLRKKDSSNWVVSFKVDKDLDNLDLMLIYPLGISNQIELTDVKINDEEEFDYFYEYKSVELENKRQRDSLKLIINKPIAKGSIISFSLTNLEILPEGFYLYLKDKRLTELLNYPVGYEKVYFSLQYNLISIL